MSEIFRKGEKQPARAVGATAPAQGHVARRELLYKISNFLLDLELEVNPANLKVAQEVIVGTNSGVSQQVAARQLAGEPVTQSWLADVISQAERDQNRRAKAAERETLHPLIEKLAESLQRFAQNTAEAGATAQAYHAALVETAATLDAARPVVELPTLAQLTGTMIERTRSVEAEMRLREGDAAGLREKLQLAWADTAIEHLTGIDNAQSFDAVLEREYRAARGAREALSIAFCGIDHFHAITAAHGRDTGDRLIEALARGVRRISAQSCHVARHGGEQFVLLYRGISIDDVHQQLDEARQKFAQRKLINRATEIPIGTVTFSGVVADALAYAGPRAALKAAEDAFCQAKEQGSNRIVNFAAQAA